MTEFREAFPDLNFWGVGDMIAEGDYVVARWDGGGTHTGSAFSDLPVGSLPAKSGKRIRFTGTTVMRIENGKVAEELGQEGALTALPSSDWCPASVRNTPKALDHDGGGAPVYRRACILSRRQ